jgi:two-component system sensor histidine kinase KdpD
MAHRSLISPRRIRAALVAVAAPSAVTLLAALPSGVSAATAALLYVLAVIAAVLVAGFWAGLATSVLAFLALNFFFTEPLHTLSVQKVEDIVALVVFLLVSAIVGTLLSTALLMRARAERREREARLLQHLRMRLAERQPLEQVLHKMAQGITELFELSRCEIVADALGTSPVVVGPPEGTGEPGSGESEVFPMVGRAREEGRIVVEPGPSREGLADHEREVIRTFATQIAFALESTRLSDEAERARVEADVNRARAALYSSVSHDLRTPLASITAAVTSLLDDEATLGEGDRRELMETIRQEAARLNRLVGNLLHLSRIRAGGVVPARTPTDISEVIEGVVARLRPTLQHHRVRLVLRENLPEVPLDVMLIDQALTNLLENAARFSPQGSEIAVFATTWGGDMQIRVSDQGPGIPVEERERVFEPFVRSDGASRSGTGLGLAIARAIVEAHGGRIRVEGAPTGGTSMTIRLPVEAPTRSPHEAER